MGMQALSTGVYGSLWEGTAGLLLGRGSTIMQGGCLLLLESLTADFEGEIKDMPHSPNGATVVKTGQRFAQLILLSKVQIRN